MGRRREKIYWDGDDDLQAETTWDGDGGRGERPKRRKRANTPERNSSTSEDGGAVAVAAGNLSPSINANAATTVDPRERHKLAERERRKSMRELFLSLHSLLPNGDTVRKEQSAILDEIIKYIPLAASRLRSLRIDAQRLCRTRRRKENCLTDPITPEAAGGDSPKYTAAPTTSTSSSCSSLSSSSSSTDMNTTAPLLVTTNLKRRRETCSSGVNYYTCNSRSGSSNSLNTLATRSPSSGHSEKIGGSSTTLPLSDHSCAVDIRLAPEPASSVSIRLRGDRVNVSLTDHSYAKLPTPPVSSSAQPVLLLSAVVEELDAHQLELIRSTHCRDGSKLLHYSESKVQIQEDEKSTDGSFVLASPEVLKGKLQHLASKLQTLRKTANSTRICASSK